MSDYTNFSEVLKICNKASPGPWKATYDESIPDADIGDKKGVLIWNH